MTDTLRMIAWEPLAGVSEATASVWIDHRTKVMSDPAALSATRFEVVGGHCAFVCITELTSPPGDAGNTAGALVYRQVFNAPDARPFPAISDYLFVVRA